MSKKGEVYTDPETGLTLRSVDFNDREDVDLYIKAEEDFAEITSIPFVPKNLVVAFGIGQAMRYDHLRRYKTRFLFIYDRHTPLGVVNIFPVIEDSPTKEEIYPVFQVETFRTVEVGKVADAYHAVARMLRKEGNGRVFCHVPYGHRALKGRIRKKRELGDFRKAVEILEVDV
jgi:hypothetical protein